MAGFTSQWHDLLLRGPGDLLGEAQSGLPPRRFGNLLEDFPLITRAKALAAEVLAKQ